MGKHVQEKGKAHPKGRENMSETNEKLRRGKVHAGKRKDGIACEKQAKSEREKGAEG